MSKSKGKKVIDPFWPVVPKCVTPDVPAYEVCLPSICKAMTLPIMTEQQIDTDGTLFKRNYYWFEKKYLEVPTYFICKWSLRNTKTSTSTYLFELDRTLIRILEGMDDAHGRQTKGLFVFESHFRCYSFSPLNEIVQSRYQMLDISNIEKQDMIKGKQKFNVDNHDVDFIFAFLNDTYNAFFINFVNFLGKPVFLCGQFIKSNKFLKN